MQNQSSSNEMLPFDPSDAWTRFGHAKVIKKWAGELLAALAAGAKADWELTGRAIFIQHDKPDECFELVQLAASVAGISALRLNPADIKEPAQGLIAEAAVEMVCDHFGVASPALITTAASKAGCAVHRAPPTDALRYCSTSFRALRSNLAMKASPSGSLPGAATAAKAVSLSAIARGGG